MEPWKRRLFSARRRVFALWLALCCCCVSAFGGSLLAEASRLGGKRKGAACLGAPLCAPRRSIPGSLCCLSAPLDFARRLFSGALHSSAEFPSQSSSSPSSTAPLLAARPPPPSSSASDDLPLNSASSQTDAAEAERAVEEAASWFEAQQKLWSDRAAKLLGLMLEERRHARELQASARASGDSSAKKKKQREHRLVFETPSLLDRGWLAALSGAEDFSKTAVCPGVGKAPSLSCVLFAATPPGRVAVAPLRFLSKAASQGSVFEKGEREATGEEGGRRKGRRVLCLDARAARAIPWVSLEGLVRLRRNSRDRALALWFGGEEHVPDLECFYENAPFSVLLVREVLDRPFAVPALLVAGSFAAVAAARGELQRQLVSLLLSKRLWSSYALWSPLTRAPPALALLFVRLLLHAAAKAASVATAVTRDALEDLEAKLLERSVQCNVLFREEADSP